MFTILEFHNISKKGVGWTNVSPARFSKILDILQSEAHIITPSEIETYIAEPNHAECPHVMLSFDDGYEEIFTAAYPIMKERGIVGMVSIVVGHTGKANSWDILGGTQRHLNWRQIDELLSEGWSVCSHTMTHPDLKRCTDDRLEWELVKSKAILEHHLQKEMFVIAYPFGRFNLRVLRAAAKTGYRIGFTVGAEAWHGIRGPLTTIRVPVYSVDSNALIRAKVKPDGFAKRYDAWKNRFFNKLSLGTSFVHRHRYKDIPPLSYP